MVKRGISGFLCIIFSLLQLSGQPEIKRGEKFEDNNKLIGYVLGAGDSTFSVLLRKGGTFTVNYDYEITTHSKKTLEIVSTTELTELEFKEEKASFYKGYTDQNGSSAVYFTAFDGGEDKRYLARMILDQDGNKSELEPVAQYATRDDDDGKFVIGFSPDSTKVLIFGQPEDWEDRLNLTVHVEDRHRAALWSNSYQIPYDGRDLEILDAVLFNSGEVFMTAYDEENEIHKIFKLTKDGMTTGSFRISRERAVDLQLAPGFTDGLVTILGSYSNSSGGLFGGSSDKINGFFAVGIDPEELKPKLTEYQPLRQVTSSINFPNVTGESELEDFKLRHVIESTDGPIVTYEQSKDFPTEDRVYFGSVMVLKYDPDLSLDWSAVIPQYHSVLGGAEIFSSYMLVPHKNAVSFFINEHPSNSDNILEGKVEVLNAPMRSNVVQYKLHFDGKLERKVVGYNAGKPIFVPRISKHTGGGEAILFFRKKYEQQLGKLLLK